MFELDDVISEHEFADFSPGTSGGAGLEKNSGAQLLRSGAIEDITGLNLPAALGRGGALSKNGQLVKRTLRSLVGSDDPKTFAAALRSSFRPANVGGKRIFQWKPTPTAALIGAAGLRNAQPQLFIRARERLDKALELLEVIKPFICDLDCEKLFETARVVVRERIVELIEEFSKPAGPNAVRVDFIFEALLDGGGEFAEFYQFSGADPIVKDGRTPIINLSDSANFTNLLSLVDDLKTVFHTWQTFGVYFDRARVGDAPLGVQLSVLYDAIQVANRSLADWLVDCDEADFDEADRLALRVEDSRQSMSAAQLVEWAQEVTGDMSERLLQGAGVSAVKIYSRTLAELIDWFERLQTLACEPLDEGCDDGDVDGCAVGLHRKKVQRGLAELICYLEDAEALSDLIGPVFVADLTPRYAAAKESVTQAPAEAGDRPAQAEIVFSKAAAQTGSYSAAEEAEINYILADLQLSEEDLAPYYRPRSDSLSQEALRRWDAGFRVANIKKFTRHPKPDGEMGIFTRRGDKLISGAEVELMVPASSVE